MLRAPEPDDLDVLYKWENDPERLLYGRTGLPYPRKLLADYIAGYNEVALNAGHIRFLVDSPDGETIGILDLYDLDLSARKAFVSIYIDAGSRGKGLASAAVDEAIEFARGHLGLYQLVVIVSSENPPSSRLFLSKGFKKIATLPHWLRNKTGELVEAEMLALVL